MLNNLVKAFLVWFFAAAPLEIVRLGRNFLRWGWKFFSIGFFLPRLFSPWHKDLTPYGRGFDLQRWLHIWGWNTLSRVIGAVMRLVVIGTGVVVEFFLLLFFTFVFVLWYALPVFIPALFATSLLSFL